MRIQVLASGSSGNCYAVTGGETTILLDGGIPIGKIREGLGFRLSAVQGVFITHSHGDHSKAVPGLLRAGIPVYLPGGEMEAMKLEKSHRLHVLEKANGLSYRSVHIGGFIVVPFSVEHDTPEPVGYLVQEKASGETLLYFTDTYYLRWRFHGVTHIIGEVNYTRDMLHRKLDSGETDTARARRLFTSHMSLETFLGVLEALVEPRLQQVYICHMSEDNGDAEAVKEAVQRATGAEVIIC